MEENKTNREEPEKFSVLLTDEEQQAQQEQSETQKQENQRQLKKWLVFALMGLVFSGCMYLLFFMGNDANDKKNSDEDLVPEPTEISLPEDKGQAYEQALLEQKRKEKQTTMQSLDHFSEEGDSLAEEDKTAVGSSLASYKNINEKLGNFYEKETNDEDKIRMQEEIEQLKAQLESKQNQDPLETQMKLMEHSYQLASKYTSPQNSQAVSNEKTEKISKQEEDNAYISRDKEAGIAPVYSVSNKVVSRLPRALSNEKLLEKWVQQNQRGFYSVESQKEEKPMLKNSIKACIHTEQRIDKNSRIPLRLLEPIRVAGIVLPKGTLLTAMAKIGEGRLLLDISSLEYQGRIVPISVTAYDLDGQRGLYIPYTPENNAFREIAVGLSQSSGTNYNFSSSAKDQILSEVGKGILQGSSSYISKKIAYPQIKVKAGYQLLLVSKP